MKNHSIKVHRHCVCTSLVALDHQASVNPNPFYVKPEPSVLDDMGASSTLKNFTFPEGKAGFTKDVFLICIYIFIYIYIYKYVL